MYQRASLNWDGEWLEAQAFKMFGEERGQSLATRIDAENQLTQHALEDAPDKWFGFGKWDIDDPDVVPWRINEIYYRENKILATEHMKYVKNKKGKLIKKKWNEPGPLYRVVKDRTITDGLWVITLGQFGLASLIALTVTLLLGAVIMLIRVPMRFWDHPMVAPAAALAVLLVLDMSDNLLNGMLNPVFILCLGGICGIGPSVRKIWKAKAQQAQMGPGSRSGTHRQACPAPAAAPGGAGPPRTAACRRRAPGYGQPAYGPGMLAGFPVIPGPAEWDSPEKRKDEGGRMKQRPPPRVHPSSLAIHPSIRVCASSSSSSTTARRRSRSTACGRSRPRSRGWAGPASRGWW